MTCGVYDYVDPEYLNLVASILLGHILYRITHIVLEYLFRRSHYNTSKNVLLQISTHFKPDILTLFMFFPLSILFNSINFNQTLVIVTFTLKTINAFECSYDLIKFLRKGSGVDFASGMAANFFHGFLKIVLKEDTDGNSFIKRLEDYEDGQGVNFAIQKLFVLIPRSCVLQMQFGDDWIEVAKSLETKFVNRGGLSKRAYNVGVYRFKNRMARNCDKTKINFYVTAISATPLITFHEFLEFNPHVVPYKTEVLKNFVKELKRLISLDREIKNLVEIVEFDDDREEAAVGQVLERRVMAMWSQGL
ncbi:TMEM173.2 family protein [Megaselia abdita]